MASVGRRLNLPPPLASSSLGSYLGLSPSSCFPLCLHFATTRARATLPPLPSPRFLTTAVNSSPPVYIPDAHRSRAPTTPERRRSAAVAEPRPGSIFHSGQLVFVVLERCAKTPAQFPFILCSLARSLARRSSRAPFRHCPPWMPASSP
jgi:hypothetical protein